jgi:hypothetical protein
VVAAAERFRSRKDRSMGRGDPTAARVPDQLFSVASFGGPGFDYRGPGSTGSGSDDLTSAAARATLGGISAGVDGEPKSLAKVASGSSRRSSEEVAHPSGRAFTLGRNSAAEAMNRCKEVCSRASTPAPNFGWAVRPALVAPKRAWREQAL